ncbi:O-antigen ligase family protein [candidate division KSB1 bacterium]
MFNNIIDFFKSNSFFRFSIYGFAFSSTFSVAAGQIFLSFVVLSWLIKMILNKKIIYRKSPIDIFILAYLISQVIASLFSQYKIESLSNVLNNEWIVILFFAIASNIDEESFKRAIIILITSSAIVSIYSIGQHYFGYDIYRSRTLRLYGGFYRAEGFFGMCLTYGGYVMAVTVTAMGGFFSHTHRKLKWFFGVTSLVLFYSVIVSYTRSNWIAVHLAGFVLSFLKGFRYILVFIGFILVFWLMIYYFHTSLLTFKSFESMVDVSQDMPKSNMARLELWKKSLEIFKDHPIFGLGIGQLKKVHDEYDFPVVARYGHPHNDFLNIGVNSGLIGLIPFVLIWFIFFKSVLRKYFFSEDVNKNSLLLSLVLGGAIAVFGFLVSGLFQCYYTDLEDGMLWWFITALTMGALSFGTSNEKKLFY